MGMGGSSKHKNERRKKRKGVKTTKSSKGEGDRKMQKEKTL